MRRRSRARKRVIRTITLGLVLLLGSVTLLPAGAIAQEPAERGPFQGVSLLGEDLYAQVDNDGAIAAADAALAADPDNVDLVIAAGRVRRNYWHYRDAIDLYSRAAEMAPDDWRPYRFRGHRRISVREFDRAIEDLQRARDLAPMNWDVAYHLGLAYFVSGRFDDAADEYLRCLELGNSTAARAAQVEGFRSCSQNVDDPESFVAMSEWAVRSLLRSGRSSEADGLLSLIADDLPITTNVAYYHDLLFYKGLMTADELLDLDDSSPYRLETVGFGVANWMLVHGDTERAVAILTEIAAHPWWPGFGRIAAEAELARMETGRETDELQPASGAPGPEHVRFAALTGAWRVYPSSPAGTESTAQPIGSAIAELRLGGRFLDIEARMTSGPLEHAIFTLGFDRRHGDYTVVFMDDSGSYWVSARGAANEDGSVVAMYGTDDDPVMQAMGFEKAFVIEFRFASNRSFFAEIRYVDTRTAERNELPFLTLELRR